MPSNSDSLLDVVDRIEEAIGKFERILYGDPQARQNGLLIEFEGLRKDVQILSVEVHSLKNRRPNVPMWIAGYAMSMIAGTFAIVAIVNQVAAQKLWDLSSPVAIGLSAIFAAVALFLFIGGFGWLDERA